MAKAAWDATDPVSMLKFLHIRASQRKLRLFAVACCRRTDALREKAVERHANDFSISEMLHDHNAMRLTGALSGLEQVADDAMSFEQLYYLRRGVAAVIGEFESVVEQCASQTPTEMPPYRDRPYTEGELLEIRVLGQGLCDWARAVSEAAGDEINTGALAAFQYALRAAYLFGNASDPTIFPELAVDRYYLLEPPYPPQQANHLGQFASLCTDVFGHILSGAVLDIPRPNSAAENLASAIYTDRAFDRLPILADALEDAGCTQPDILDHCRGPGPHARGCWVVDLLLGKE